MEKGLKQVMIAPIDNCDADRHPGEPVNGFEPSESGADHDRMMSAHHPIRRERRCSGSPYSAGVADPTGRAKPARGLAVFLEGLAKTESGELHDGFAYMHRGTDLLRQ
jgi:hypothetical protein